MLSANTAPELLAPAGSLDSAYYALQAGADAVYFGLQDFSARAAARNFSLEDARRLRSFSRQMGRRIYAAVNTLILPQEQQQLAETVRFLDYLEVDAVILQDLAAVAIFRSLAPHIPRHGSTQMAVHDAAGARWTRQLGLSRVVLAREMTAGETAALQQELAGAVELEVFIHGAQCWSFSGLCLASGRLLGRSANRGRCAQICRSRFGDQHPFSADDKALGEEVLAAAAMGVQCLKIEGRMKSPAYAAATVSWYRNILDHATGTQPVADVREHIDRVRTVFARNWSSGFWSGPSAGINLQYPGATGIPAGTVEAVRQQAFRMTANCDLHVRDGVLLETDGGYAQTGVAAISACQQSPLHKRNRKTPQTQLAAGKCAWISVAGDLPLVGTPVRVVSRHDSELPAAPTASMPVWKPQIYLEIQLLPEGMRVSCPWHSELFEIPWETARSPGKLPSQLERVFSTTADWFEYSAGVTGSDHGWFYPASALKSIRRDWVARAEQAYWSLSLTDDRPVSDVEAVSLQGRRSPAELLGFELPARRELQQNGIPFYFPGDPLAPWIPISGPVVLPLFPISLGLPDWQKLEGYLSRQDRPWVVLGLGNFSAAEQYQRVWSNYPRTAAFLDYGLYTLTRRARREYTARLPRVAAAAPWLEGNDCEPDSLTLAMGFTDFSPPLFISRNCYRRTRCNSCSGCDPRQPQLFEVEQGTKGFQIIVCRCWSLVFASGR